MSDSKLNNRASDYEKMDMLRFTTAGIVDDGKSTLIGRLLYDSKSIFEDQMEAIEKTSRSSGEEEVNLALLTDGLKAEREQKITIDVAYRYFATPRRKFIIADTPRSHSVHPKHGHRRIYCRFGDNSGRCKQGPTHPISAACLHFYTAAHTPFGGGRKQNGSGRVR